MTFQRSGDGRRAGRQAAHRSRDAHYPRAGPEGLISAACQTPPTRLRQHHAADQVRNQRRRLHSQDRFHVPALSTSRPQPSALDVQDSDWGTTDCWPEVLVQEKEQRICKTLRQDKPLLQVQLDDPDLSADPQDPLRVHAHREPIMLPCRWLRVTS